MARGSYKHTIFDYSIIDDKEHGWWVLFKIDGVTHNSQNSFSSEMLARKAVQAEARTIIDSLEENGDNRAES